MKWKKLYRNEAGKLEWYTIEELRECESTSVVFWNSREEIAEMIYGADFLLFADANPEYTHYCRLTNPTYKRTTSKQDE